MTLLKSIIGSRYVTDGNATDVTDFIQNNPNEVIDISNCLISASIATIIEKNAESFIDTINEERNKILDYNKVAKHNRDTLESKELPDLTIDQVLTDYLSSLREETVYQISSKKKFALAAFVLVITPKQRLSFGYLTEDFGQYLVSALYQQSIDVLLGFLTIETEFLWYSRKQIVPVSILSFDRETVRTTKGTFDTMDILSKVFMIPSRIGTERITRLEAYTNFWTTISNEVCAPESKELSLATLLMQRM